MPRPYSALLQGSTRAKTRSGRCPPAPPASFRASLLTTKILPTHEPLIRIHQRDREPLVFSKSVLGNRFDPLPSPWDATEVLYCGSLIETAVAETVLRWHDQIEPGSQIILPQSLLTARHVARFVPRRPLTIIDATALGLARIREVVARVLSLPENVERHESADALPEDIFQCGANDYVQTEQWGAWFRTQLPRADGLVWISRQFNLGRCLVLFADRCSEDLQLVEPPKPLYAEGCKERSIVQKMLGQLGWGVE